MAVVLGIVVAVVTAIDLFVNFAFYRSTAESQALEKAQVLAQEMQAVWDYNVNVQDVANRNPDGSVRSKQLVCVVAAKSVSALFTQNTDYEISFVRTDPRQVSATPDGFEAQALAQFEAGDDTPRYGVVPSEQGDVFRYVVPIHADDSCLECHGDPAGELDQYGYAKEGMAVGDVAGAMSIVEPMRIYYEVANAGILVQLAVMLSLVTVVLVALYVAADHIILAPVRLFGEAAARVGKGDLSASFVVPNVSVRDEMSVLGDELEDMASQLRTLYGNLEEQVESKTEQLRCVNAELVEKEEKLEAALDRLGEEMAYKNDFFAIVGHELKTPLTSIKAYARILADDEANGVSVQEPAREIAASADTLLAMVNNILTLAQNDANRNELVVDPVDIVDLVGHIRRALSPVATAKGIDFQTSVANDAALAMVDAEKVRRILENLVDNAIKYTRSGGSVKLDVYLDDGTDNSVGNAAGNCDLVFVVADTGTGIEAREIPELFERFRQVGGSGKRHKGTGLGLAVVKELAQLHGGSASVESEPGVGSTFIVRIPFVEVDMEEYDEDTAHR